MSALISQVARLVFGDARRKSIVVLGAFSDDSGTHAKTPVVAIGGLLGDEKHWDDFNPKWQAALREPAPGKPPIRSFHLTECRAGEGIFRDYKPVEREYAIAQFRDIILDSDLITLAAAVDENSWRDLVHGEVAEELGDSLGLCFFKCVEMTFQMARMFRPGEPVVFFFDKGNKSRLDMWTRLYSMQKETFPELDLMGFMEVEKHPPMQGADYIANNTYRLAQKTFKNGEDADEDPSFHRFMKRDLSCGLVFGREQLQEVVKRVEITLASRKKSS